MFDWLVIPLFLLVGFFFLWIFFKIFTAGDARQSAAEQYEQQMMNTQQARTNYKIGLLWQIKGTPESQRGLLWSEYNLLDAEDKALTRAEIKKLVDMETVLDDQTLYELENGINPYKTEKPVKRRAALKARRARA